MATVTRQRREVGSAALSRRLHDILRDRIISFELKPFEQVSEHNIAAEFNVSRTPVREALMRLSELGLVDIYPQRGTVIAPLRIPDLEKSQFMREALEIALLKRAMEGPNCKELAEQLRGEIALQKALVEINDMKRFYAADEVFHGLIAAYAGLPTIVNEIERAKIHMDRFRHLMLSGIENIATILKQHAAIVDSISERDVGAAQAAMQLHLRRILEFVDKAIERHPEYFSDAGSDPLSVRRKGPADR
ncbi:GntR family transcriptional regulator [Rhizobium sp. KVB221]|uniref:GntR family transcriptional regulator n=1 Tax=Rhizobium setariae TaxID=2801340 RepID=A0A936YMQ3_9HYPH|nr:GntR family transcriptional regulator [Rhizobium setariae]MBL0371567.1 GntR family transcriptional regulator [Rhizobium setariae]